MKKIYLVLVMLITIAFSANAQTTSYPWVIGTGVNFVDFMAPQLTLGTQFSETTWEGAEAGYPFHLYASRFLFQGFSLTFDFNTINVPDKNIEKYMGKSKYITRLWENGEWGSGGTYENGLHIGAGRMFYGHLSLQYNFFSSLHEKRLKNERRKFIDVFDPYIIVGVGATTLYEDDKEDHYYFSQQTGVGFNFWIQKNVGLYAEGDYTFIPDRDDYMSYKFGLKVRFGKDKDIDKDGIQNSKDKCPELPGPKETNGCPDQDGDGVTDDVDKCPKEPGSPEFMGCNDRDGDGVADFEDSCPDIKGPKEFNGCPDRDGDGVYDLEDSCPDVAGEEKFNGCPDTDGDGLPDNKDKCPDLAGDEAFEGCPDRDGDGISDFEDKCPDVPGTAEFMGCADRDGDGISDFEDQCPDIPGLAEFNGCADRDGDGISDLVDSCPDEAGLEKFKGCPDRDNDGIPDKFDNCPDKPGTEEMDGCPEEVMQEIEKQLSFNAESIYFESGKSTIRSISYQNLDNILKILNDFPKIRLKIEGHTDNTGSREINLKLSEDRAFAVMNYFTARGIDAARFQANGYGPDRPVATNETSDGRAANRRTEIHLIQD